MNTNKPFSYDTLLRDSFILGRPWIAFDGDEPATEPPATGDDPGKKTGTEGADDPTPTPKFTQEDVDRLIKERLARQKAQYEDEQRKAQSAAEQKQLEEKEQFKELAEKRQGEVEALTKRLEAMEAERLNDKKRRALEAEASKANFANPGDAAVFVQLDQLEMDEDGNVKNAGALIKALADERPYLLQEAKPSPGNSRGPRPAAPAGDAERDKAARDSQRRWAHRQF